MKGAFFFCDNKLIFSRKICIFGNRTTLCDMEIWIVWLIVAAILLATEVLTQMMWALCDGRSPRRHDNRAVRR